MDHDDTYTQLKYLVVVEQVGGFEVAMDVPMPVHVLRGEQQLLHKAFYLTQGKRALSDKIIGKRMVKRGRMATNGEEGRRGSN